MITDDVLGYRGTTVVVTGCASRMGQATATILGESGSVLYTDQGFVGGLLTGRIDPSVLVVE